MTPLRKVGKLCRDIITLKSLRKMEGCTFISNNMKERLQNACSHIFVLFVFQMYEKEMTFCCVRSQEVSAPVLLKQYCALLRIYCLKLCINFQTLKDEFSSQLKINFYFKYQSSEKKIYLFLYDIRSRFMDYSEGSIQLDDYELNCYLLTYYLSYSYLRVKVRSLQLYRMR